MAWDFWSVAIYSRSLTWIYYLVNTTVFHWSFLFHQSRMSQKHTLARYPKPAGSDSPKKYWIQWYSLFQQVVLLADAVLNVAEFDSLKCYQKIMLSRCGFYVTVDSERPNLILNAYFLWLIKDSGWKSLQEKFTFSSILRFYRKLSWFFRIVCRPVNWNFLIVCWIVNLNFLIVCGIVNFAVVCRIVNWRKCLHTSMVSLLCKKTILLHTRRQIKFPFIS